MCGSISELNFHTEYAGELVRSFRCSTRPVSQPGYKEDLKVILVLRLECA
jgi:hypothetical protein